ncbi:MAG: DNA methyltransferase [candidate division SR1 bacterium]|nr:DNA methyltransferase [candidate division SR1 bacterium]
MYFAILGKNPDISKAELELIQPTNISSPKKGIITFDTNKPELISTLGGIIKAGSIVKEKDLPEVLKDVKIIGIKEIANGKHLKQTIGIKRFKTVDFFHTDKEIKEKGMELINLGNGDYGRVEWYQNIPLYETIDFDKPARSMHMGMMPAKLTHMMINIGLHSLKSKVHKVEGLDRPEDLIDLKTGRPDGPSTVIYDPFVGSGTTGFLANTLGFEFIGSDINISYVEQNAKWRAKTPFANSKSDFQIFQHDITTPLTNKIDIADSQLLIISEGRLGPIVTARTSPETIQRNQKEVLDMYKAFLQRIKELSTGNIQPVTVITIPYYQTDNFLEKELVIVAQKFGLSLSSISEIYQRENQKIGRKILIIS